ncbi:MAG: hypothetical protein GY801_04150 [bacterium]|nr:hypothetical protein [bacterium]
MKNIAILLLLFVVLCGWPYMVPAHKIYMKDESVIRSDTVWEQTLGYFLDEVSLYAYKKAGMPERLVKRLTPLQDQLIRSKERLLQLITQQIGAEALRTYLPTIEKYLVEEKVVSYDKFGDTIHLERSKVKQIEYSKPLPPIAPGLIDPQDMETRRAIEAEKALLYERLRKIRDLKSDYVPDDSGLSRSDPVNYKKEMRKTQQQLKELNRNPLGYFLRYYPDFVNFEGKLSSSDCHSLCGNGASSPPVPHDDDRETPLIRADSDEKLQRYKRCMASCLQEEHGNEDGEEQTK